MDYNDDSTSGPSHEDHNESERLPKRRKTAHGMEALLAREVGFMRDGGSSSSFVGSASGIYFIRSVYGALGSTMIDTTSPETNVVPGEDDRLAHNDQIRGGQKFLWQSHEVEARSTARPFTFDDLLSWSSSYFDNWHPAFPLFHASDLLKFMERLGSANELIQTNADSWECTMVKAVISISLLDRRQSDQVGRMPKVPEDLVFSSFDQALASTAPALSRPATVLGLQALLCVQLFLVSMLRLNAAAKLGGLITQIAFQLGLHRCPMRYQTFSVEDRQLRRRVFWSMYCIERYVCQALGLPLTTRDADVDVCHLNKELHESHTQQRQSANANTGDDNAGQEGYDERLQLLSFLAEHAQIRGSIIELRNKRVEERDKNPDTATFINARLTHWWNEVEDFLEQAESRPEPPISKYHSAVLQILRHESVIMLYRPLLALPKHNANYEGAVHACIGAAKALLSILASLTSTTMDGSQQGNSRTTAPMVWHSFTWAAWMSAFIMLYGAAEEKVATLVASRNVDKALKVLEKLSTRGSVWPDGCAVAIRDLRSILTAKHRLGMAQKSQHNTQIFDAERSTSANARSHVVASNSIQPKTNKVIHGDETLSASRHIAGYAMPHTAERPDHVGRGWQVQHQYARDGFGSNGQPNYRTSPGMEGNLHSSIETPNVGVLHGPTTGLSLDAQQSSPFHDEPWLGSGILPKDVPPTAFGGLDPFSGFDIPFWVGQDNYMAWMGSTGT